MKKDILLKDLDDLFNPQEMQIVPIELNESVTETSVPVQLNIDYDKLISEWSYRCRRGYPIWGDIEDMLVLQTILEEYNIPLPFKRITAKSVINNANTKVLHGRKPVVTENSNVVTKNDIIKQIKSTKLSDSDLQKINQLIITAIYKPQVIKYLASKNIVPENYQLGDEAVNLILSKITALPNAADVVKYFEKPVMLKWGTDGRGNIQQLTGLPDSTIARLITIQPGADSGGSATGPAEIAFSLLFKNIKNSSTSGDLEMDGKTVELKGRDGRLGSQSGRGKEMNVKSSFVGQMIKQAADNKTMNEFISNKDNINIAYAIFNAYDILVNSGIMPKKEFITNVQQGLSDIYFNKSIVVKKYFNNSTKWTSAESIGRQLVKTNLEAYMTKINNEIIIFHRFRETGKSPSLDLSFVVIDKSDIDSVIDTGVITLGSLRPESSIFWHDTNPSVKLNI